MLENAGFLFFLQCSYCPFSFLSSSVSVTLSPFLSLLCALYFLSGFLVVLLAHPRLSLVSLQSAFVDSLEGDSPYAKKQVFTPNPFLCILFVVGWPCTSSTLLFFTAICYFSFKSWFRGDGKGFLRDTAGHGYRTLARLSLALSLSPFAHLST